MDYTVVLQRMKDELSFLGTSIWTMTTMLVSAMIFYYGIQNNKNYGVPNRKIIAYMYGSLYIPIVVILIIFVVAVMTYAYYISAYDLFYFFSAAAIVFQLEIIYLCLSASSNANCFKAIIKVEKIQYNWIQEVMAKDKDEDTNYDLEMQRRYSANIFHVDMIMSGEETLVEKLEIIQNILLIPLYSNRDNDRMKLQDLKAIYYYISQNIRLVIRDLEKQEQQRLYSILYETIRWYSQKYEQEKNNGYKKQIYIFLSALLHEILKMDVFENKQEFVMYIIKNVLESEETKSGAIGVLVCMYEYLAETGIDIKRDIVCTAKMLSSLEMWKFWQPDKEQVSDLMEMVVIWLYNTTLSVERKKDIYKKIYEGLTKKRNKSVIGFFLSQR